jgi:hypothetical protein
MGFQVVVTNLETHIFTMASTLHGTTIGNHDLEIIDDMDVAMSFLGNAAMNKIMGVATINQNDDLLMLDVIDYVEDFGSGESHESIEGNDWFYFERV